MKWNGLLRLMCLLLLALVMATSQAPLNASSDAPAAPNRAINTVLYDTVSANVASISVGDAVQVFPPYSGFVEVSTVAYGPGENSACSNGRILFAAGPKVVATTLSGAIEHLAGSGTNGVRDLTPTNETFPPGTSYDGNLVKLNDGSLVLGAQGVTWNDNIFPHPWWWNYTTAYPLAGDASLAHPGGRVLHYIFRSTDCGATWTPRTHIDPARLLVSGTAGFCSPPRLNAPPQPANVSKWSWYGGWDGPFLYADPYSGYLYWSAPCNYGDTTEGHAYERGILAVSRDKGGTWTVIGENPNIHAWRLPFSSVRDGTSSKIGFLFGLGGTPNILKLLTFDPSANSLDFTQAVTIGTYTWPPSYPVGINSDNTGIPLYGGLVGDNMSAPRFYASVPNWTGTGEFAFSLFHTDATGGGTRSIDFTPKPANTGGAIWQADYIEPPPGETTSVFYWTDIKATNPNVYEERFEVFKDGEPLLVEPGRLTLQNGTPYTYQYVSHPFIGDYQNGGSYHDSTGATKFVVPWSQNGSLHFNTVTVGPPVGRPWIGTWHFDALAQQLPELNSQGYVMQDVNGVVLPSGESRWNAIWTRSSEDRNAIAAWAEADFVPLAQQRHTQGYELIALNGIVLPGDQVRYNAVWTKTTVAHPYAYNRTRAEFDQLVVSYRNLHYELANLSAMVLSGDQVRYNAVWVPANELRRSVWDWLFQDLNQQDVTNRSQGYRMIDVNTMVRSNNTPYYNAIWVHTTQDRPAVWSWAPKDFSTLNTQLLHQGYHIARLNSFFLNGPGVLYDAIWEPDIRLLLPFVSR